MMICNHRWVLSFSRWNGIDKLNKYCTKCGLSVPRNSQVKDTK